MLIGEDEEVIYPYWAYPDWTASNRTRLAEMDEWCNHQFKNKEWCRSESNWMLRSRKFQFMNKKDRDWFALRWI